MSLEAMTRALDADVGDPTRKLVLIGLANHAHRDGRNSWASRDTIASYVGCHPKTVRRHVQALIAGGWIQEGDQQQVAHVRADRRPVVYDLAMTEAVRAEWEAATGDAIDPAEHNEPRGDNLSPREPSTGGHSPVPPQPATGGHTGGHRCPPRGDKAVSPEPSTEPKNYPPTPHAALAPALGLGCSKPGPTPHPNCRGCGTTTRQIEAQVAADAEAGRRAESRAEFERSRAERAQPPDPATAAAIAAHRSQARAAASSAARKAAG